MNAPSQLIEQQLDMPKPPAAGLAPSLERKRLQLYLALMLVDIALLLLCNYISSELYLAEGEGRNPMLGVQLLLPLFLTIALYNGTYSLGVLTDWHKGCGKMLMALVLAAAFLNFFAFFARTNTMFSRFILLSGVGSAAVLMCYARYLVYKVARRKWGPSPLNLLVIEAGGPKLNLPHAFQIDAAEHCLAPTLDDPHALDRLSRYVRNMDEVIVNCPLEDRPEWAMALKSSGIHGEVTSNLVREIGVLGVINRDEHSLSTLLVSTGPLGLRERIAKRLFDVAFSLLALIALAPVLLAAMLAVKLNDGGPVFFRQRRLGRGNRFFSIYKLRTMRVDGSDTSGTRSTDRDDDRITRVGGFLRKSSLDELPQLFNVLLGDMSMVGPRPHALGSLGGDKLFWQIDQRYWHRHTLRPGITGLAQIRGFRGATETETDLTSRLQADLEYLARWSIWRDIAIIAATIRVLVHDRAY